jgi:hypothetical protein
MPRWGPAEPKTRVKVAECGRGHWDEQDHGLDIPHAIETIDFKHACSFVLFDTKARATVIGFEREDDADAFRTKFIS